MKKEQRIEQAKQMLSYSLGYCQRWAGTQRINSKRIKEVKESAKIINDEAANYWAENIEKEIERWANENKERNKLNAKWRLKLSKKDYTDKLIKYINNKWNKNISKIGEVKVKDGMFRINYENENSESKYCRISIINFEKFIEVK